MGWPEAGKLALDGLVAALLSSPCAVCGRVALTLAGGAVCDGCWQNVAFVAPPLCVRCGAPVPSWHAATTEPTIPSLCECPNLPSSIDAARALGFYDGTLKTLIHALKYGGRRSIALPIARLALERCAPVLSGAQALVPVPLHPLRRWSRGFNQSEEIAKHLPLPVWRVLRRVRHTPAQAGLTGTARLRNVVQAFAPRPLSRCGRVRDACVVLIDDVSTTGATLGACAEVLKEMGAREVRALTMARTPLRR